MNLQEKLSQSFKDLGSRLNGSESKFLRELRARSFDYFKGQGFPSNQDEEWKYTPLDEIYQTKLEMPVHSDNDLSADILESTSVVNEPNLLKIILKHSFEFDYRIKLIGRGEIPTIALDFPERFIICQNRNLIDFHQQFHDCYCIMTLTTRKRKKKY